MASSWGVGLLLIVVLADAAALKALKDKAGGKGPLLGGGIKKSGKK